MQQAPFPTIFPETAAVSEAGHLVIGGCDTLQLVAEFGTPLYVFDEVTLRGRCQEFLREFGDRYPEVRVIYACKAFVNRAVLRLLAEEGLGLDVVSAGELAVARSVEAAMDRVYFHGNNKGEDELRPALDWGIGRVVVDNFSELALLERLCAERGTVQDILLRLSPGVDPHTHAYTTTGITDSKFGFPLATGQAVEAVHAAQAASHLRLVGLHMHLGSPIFEVEPYEEATRAGIRFAAQMRDASGLDLREFSPGGGFPIQYVRERPATPIAAYAEPITRILLEECRAAGMAPPRLVLEPGRAIVGRAGVALYTVGARKDIPGVRSYVAVDGGMADNIRPALYEARYEAVVANKALETPAERVTVAGKYCESGDILLRDAELPRLTTGDVLAIPASGAYCLAMSSNYNQATKPAVVLVRDGQARLIRRRESLEELFQYDVL
ncbi:MAG: diaminopimelate decarboxylase [Chloroflexi bacterium]|nr:diaminopimelate decarboxylase [Chloroflexota bacterium]